MTIEEMQAILDELGGGVLKPGRHNSPAMGCCLHELASVCLDIDWTDDPDEIRCIDLRPLNDADWSTDELRTEWMLIVYSVWEHSLDWPPNILARRAKQVVLDVVRQIISELPDTAQESADAAARAAADAAAAYAADAAAYAAARAAAQAARAAADAAERTDDVLITACRIWLEAAHQ